MKAKLIPTALFLILTSTITAQSKMDSAVVMLIKNPAHNIEQSKKIDDVYLLAKVWGLLKYFHPQIASGKYNWDNELIDFLPGYSRIKTKKERSDSLEAWIDRFGIVEECKSCNDSLLKDAVLAPDFNWINDNNFSKQLVSKLQYVIRNRKQGDQYYVKFFRADDIIEPIFQHENTYPKMTFPADVYSLLSLFRFWNAIEYWYPYKHGMPVSWDNVLKQFIPKMISRDNLEQYTLSVEELATALHDSHGTVQSFKLMDMNRYCMPFTVKIVQQKAFVTSILNDSLAEKAEIQTGDIIESINDISIDRLMNDLIPVVPASTKGSFMSIIPYHIVLTGKDQVVLKIRRKGEEKECRVNNFIPKKKMNLAPPYFSLQKDSAFCMLSNNIGYINMGNLNRKDSILFREMITKTNGLIIDSRQGCDEEGTGAVDLIANLILPPGTTFLKYSFAQPAYPGVFSYTAPTNMGMDGSGNYYNKNIVILANEETMSVGELLTMIFRKAPRAIVMGNTTAGADGNTNYIKLPCGIIILFTGLGVYYPDGKETQRIGIKPDIFVKQTLAGYQEHKDEILEKAVEYLKAKQ